MTLNVRMWSRLGSAVIPALVLGTVLLTGFEDSPVLSWAGFAFVASGLAIVALGVVHGLKLTFGILRMKCPLCNATGKVIGGNGNGMLLDCPKCGELRVSSRFGFSLKAIRVGSEEDVLRDCPPPSENVLTIPRKYPLPFALLFLPMVATVVVASVIDQFRFFYLLIPGFFCYGVACCLIEGYVMGRLSDNSGTVVHSREPFRFWRKAGVWLLVYLFATVAPIGFAIQEREKTLTGNAAQTSPQLPETNPETCE